MHLPLAFLIASLLTAPAVAQTVRIKSSWSGFSPSPPPRVDILIQRLPDGRFNSAGTPVDPTRIATLLQAVRANPIEAPQASTLGITRQWLEDNAEAARGKDPSSPYSTVLRKASTDLPLVEAVLPSLFRGFHTDDYPSVELQIVLENGETWTASSNSQYEFMIPWQIKAPGKAFTTWNADLSKAVAALLPERAVNRVRLNGEYFAHHLGEALLQHLEKH